MIGEIEMKKMIPLLIGLLLAGAAAYYFLKRKDGGVSVPSPEGGTQSSKLLDLHDEESIIDSLSLSGELNKKCKDMAKHITKCLNNGTNGWSRSGVEKKAKDRGVTYAQQVVIESIWQMYATSKVLSSDQRDVYIDEVETLNE